MIKKRCLYCKFFSGDKDEGICRRFPYKDERFTKVYPYDIVCFEFQWHSKMFSQTKKAVELLSKILHSKDCNLPQNIKAEIKEIISSAIGSIEDSTPADMEESND